MFRLKVLPFRSALSCLIVLVTLSACGSASAATSTVNNQTTTASTPTVQAVPQIPTDAPSPVPSATREPLTLWLPDSVPQHLRETIQLPTGWSLAADPSAAAVTLEALPAGTRGP